MAAMRRQRLMISVVNSIRSLKEANGSSLKRIVAYLKSNSVQQQHPPKSHVTIRVRKIIKEAVNAGVLQASNGLFKIDVKYEAEMKTSMREPNKREGRGKKRARLIARTGRRYIFHSSRRRRKQRHRRRRGRGGRLLCRKLLRRVRPRQKRRAVVAAAPKKESEVTPQRDQSPSVKDGRGGRRKRQPSYRFNKTIIKKVNYGCSNGKVDRPSRLRVRKWISQLPSWPMEDMHSADEATY